MADQIRKSVAVHFPRTAIAESQADFVTCAAEGQRSLIYTTEGVEGRS